MRGAESACGWETLYIPPGETLAARTSFAILFSSSEREDCGDLYMPVTSIDAIVDFPTIVVLANADGDVIAVIPGTQGIVGQTHLATMNWSQTGSSDPTRVFGTIQGGDFTIDGVSDLLITDSNITIFLTSDGLGGFDTAEVAHDIAGNFRTLPGGDGSNMGPSVPGGVSFYGARSYLDRDSFF